MGGAPPRDQTGSYAWKKIRLIAKRNPIGANIQIKIDQTDDFNQASNPCQKRHVFPPVIPNPS